MFNIYGSSKQALTDGNYGSFRLDFSQAPLYFTPGSKIALLNMMIYNSIYNISSYWGNNVFYFLGKTPFGKTDAQIGADWEQIPNYSDSKYRKIVGLTGKYLYKITLPDGQYSFEALDFEIAKRLKWDLELDPTDSGEEHDLVLKNHKDRDFIIDVNETFNKLHFWYNKDDGYDILYPKSTDSDATLTADQLNKNKNILNLMGIKGIVNDSTVKTLTFPEGTFDFYSYDNNNVGGFGMGLEVADVNNGITSLCLRIRGGLYSGGKESAHDGESDILYSFNITEPPSYPQTEQPPNLIWLDIQKTGTPITSLFCEFTDQLGNPLGRNMSEESSFTLCIKEPEEDLGVQIQKLASAIGNISGGR